MFTPLSPKSFISLYVIIDTITYHTDAVGSHDLTPRLCFCFVSKLFQLQLKVLIKTCCSRALCSLDKTRHSHSYAHVSHLLLSILVCFDRDLLGGKGIHLYLNMGQTVSGLLK